jgi:hypothetical protein
VIDIESRSTVSVLSKDEINKNLFKRRLDKTGKQVLNEVNPNFDDHQAVAKMVKESLENGEICNIKGKIRLNRVFNRERYNVCIGDWAAAVLDECSLEHCA